MTLSRRGKILRRILIGVVVAVVAIYVGGATALFVLQRSYQYFPDGKLLALSEVKLPNVTLVSIPTADNAQLAGWYQAPAAGKPVILYYKGNTGSFSAEHQRFEQFVADGFGFLAFDYRGFPGSPGAITEANMLADALAAFDWVAAKGAPIVIWGRSIGSGPATYVASTRTADALLLESPFDSALSVGMDRYWFFPVAWLMLDQFRADEWIKSVDEPVFVGHGTADTTIGVEHGLRMYRLAPNRGGLWIVPGGTHSNLWQEGIWAQARAFFMSSEKAAGHEG